MLHRFFVDCFTVWVGLEVFSGWDLGSVSGEQGLGRKSAVLTNSYPGHWLWRCLAWLVPSWASGLWDWVSVSLCELLSPCPCCVNLWRRSLRAAPPPLASPPVYVGVGWGGEVTEGRGGGGTLLVDSRWLGVGHLAERSCSKPQSQKIGWECECQGPSISAHRVTCPLLPGRRFMLMPLCAWSWGQNLGSAHGQLCVLDVSACLWASVCSSERGCRWSAS